MRIFDEEMKKFDKVVISLFVVFAILAAIFGVGTVIHAYVDIRPSLSRANEEIVATLDLAERAASVLEGHPEQLDKLGAPLDSAVATSREIPVVIRQGAKISLEAADALDATARSLKGVNGAAGLVLPEDDLAQAAAQLAQTADSLRHLAPSLEALQKNADELSGDITKSASALGELQSELAAANVTLTRLVERLEKTSAAIDEAEFPVEIARLVSLQGGVYILLSVVLLGMAGMWKRMSETA
jgi:chromosome segregation ATPase